MINTYLTCHIYIIPHALSSLTAFILHSQTIMFRKPKKKPAALRSGDTKPNEPSATGGKRRRSDSSSSSDEETGETNDILKQLRQEKESQSKQPKINTSTTLSAKKSNLMHQYKSTNDQLTAKEMATRTAEHHPQEKTVATSNDNNTNHQSINKDLPSLTSNQPRNKFLAGPLKAPAFVRTTARFDYQPDICKDYKETGFCGFGDTCIYLHDRGDTKSGWEMEREYEEKKKVEEEKKKREVERFMSEMAGGKIAVEEEEEDGFDTKEKEVEDGIPFACHLCRNAFRDPIVTVCNHYFCEGCMNKRVKEVGTGCPVCQKDTHGVLNFPQKLVAKKRRLIGRDGSWEEFMAKNRR